MRLSLSKDAIAWLGQFRTDDQSCAGALLDEIVHISHQKFVEGLRDCILSKAKLAGKPIGLYAEREIRKRKGVPHRLFKEGTSKGMRAFGVGPSPVQPTRAYDPEVGSEGLVANLVTELCRQHPRIFLNHPGPDKIRRSRVRSFFLVSDFVGTGRRARSYLQAAWRVRSVRSWHSLGLMRFEVFAYSATEIGRRRVKAHPCQPSVTIALPCPTIATAFRTDMMERIRTLCVRYDPLGGNKEEALGFGGIGALIAFAHGVPNNVPRLLYRKGTVNGKPWLPLFPARSTAGVRSDFDSQIDSSDISRRLERMQQMRLSRTPWLGQAPTQARKLLLILAAVGKGPRFSEALARKTGLTVPEVDSLVGNASKYGWIDQDRRLTDAGQAQLTELKRRPRTPVEGLQEPPEPYYPTSLRAPVDSSS
jgi:hypothetical protein